MSKNGETKLTPKQEKFIQEYCVSRARSGAESGSFLNASRSAIAAGYSPKTAGQAASRLLKDVKIRAAVDSRLQNLSERCRMSAEQVLQRLADIGSLDLSNLPAKCTASAVISALELLGKYHKLWTDRHELSGPMGGVIQFALPKMADTPPLDLPDVNERPAPPKTTPRMTFISPPEPLDLPDVGALPGTATAALSQNGKARL